MDIKQLIIVSNRLPFRLEKRGNAWEVKTSSGGLVSCLQSLRGHQKSITWMGIADFKKEQGHLFEQNNQLGYKIHPLYTDKKKYRLYYDGFSNTVVWPLFHYFPSFAEFNETHFEAYREVNGQFAEEIAGYAGTGDTVWIHDYHLMLLPAMLKQKRPDLHIGFFLHIPFPSYEILKLIPAIWRNSILESLIRADIVGFHTSEYLSHFRKSLTFFLNLIPERDVVYSGGHNCVMKAYPVSVDYQLFSKAFELAAVSKGRQLIRKKHRGLKIIFSVDRLDYTKGVINRLQAYEHLLANHPDLCGKVVFVLNVVPSREQMEKYAERKKMIEENISRINGLYGDVHWQPVIYQYRHLSFNQLLSFYTVADIALITPLRDGMNLVAKEYAASRRDRKGVLVLSEFAGAAHELTGAILVNPNDLSTMKEGLLRALTLSDEEQSLRMHQMRKIIKENDIYKWTSCFLNDLSSASECALLRAPRIMSFEERRDLVDQYRETVKRLLLLDYDGTLSPYRVNPEEAVISSEARDILEQLASQPENNIYIVSGRDAAWLEKCFSGLNVGLVAEHGSMMKAAGGDWLYLENTELKWKREVAEIFEVFTKTYEGSFTEIKKFSMAYHYRGVDARRTAELKESIVRELLLLDHSADFQVIQGNMIIEVKSPASDKGIATRELLKQDEYDFVLAIGDDSTDEDMFGVLSRKNHHTIKVGIAPSGARCNLINSNNVISLLGQLSMCKSRFLRQH